MTGPDRLAALTRYAMVGDLNSRHMDAVPDGNYLLRADVLAAGVTFPAGPGAPRLIAERTCNYCDGQPGEYHGTTCPAPVPEAAPAFTLTELIEAHEDCIHKDCTLRVESLRPALRSTPAAPRHAVFGNCEHGNPLYLCIVCEENRKATQPLPAPVPEAAPGRLRDDLCPDCGHHLHRPNPGPCGWHDCPCDALPAEPGAPCPDCRDSASGVCTRHNGNGPDPLPASVPEAAPGLPVITERNVAREKAQMEAAYAAGVLAASGGCELHDTVQECCAALRATLAATPPALDVERTAFGGTIRGLRGPLVILAVRDTSTRVVGAPLLPHQVYIKRVLELAMPGTEVLVLDGVPTVHEWKRVDVIARAALAPSTDTPEDPT